MLIEFQLSADSVGEDRLSELESSVEELRGEVQEKEAELDQRERELVEGRDRITALENQILEYATIINDQTKVCEGLLCILVNFFSPSLCLFVPSVSLFLTSSFLFSVFFSLSPPPSLSLSLHKTIQSTHQYTQQNAKIQDLYSKAVEFTKKQQVEYQEKLSSLEKDIAK